jgi:oligopeptide transport system ATP-binding protein
VAELVLEVNDLKKHFPVTRGIVFMKQVGAIRAVDGVTFAITRGETFGLVGESGCGKTTTARLILMLEEITSGSILFDGKDVTEFSKLELKQYRSSVQPVFQDPFSSLSPRLKVGGIVGEPLIESNRFTRKIIKTRVAEILDLVGLTRDAAELYPHEFSGGQRQRIAVARSIALNPDLVVLDEPVSALDVSIQAQIMNLLRQLQRQLGLTYLLIAHDLAVVRHMSDKIGVMYLGKLVEVAGSDDLYIEPLHPYTRALLSAALPSHPDAQRDEIILMGEVPSPLNPPLGCRFHPRCSEATAVCSEEEPELIDLGNGRQVACHNLL